MTVTLIWILVALVAIGLYLSWTAGRLDRLHARIDATRAVPVSGAWFSVLDTG